jgi:tetratricopeptide (TPR) repeat protein
MFLEALQVPADRMPSSAAGQEGLYRSLLADKRMLIVLDNARDADQVRPLLSGGSTCLVMVTSRNQLTGLIAAEGALQVCLGELNYSDARNLLDLRLRNERVAHEPEAADKLLGLCARLPLALGIAAAGAAAHPGFPLAALVAELQQVGSTLDIFNGGDAASDLRAVFSWSYQALSAGAARTFRLVGMYPGPDVTVPAAASLAGVPVAQARRLLGELARAHLLAEHAPGRFGFHDLLRAYAVEQANLADGEGERHAAVQRLLDHYLHTARSADQLLYAYRRPIALPPLHAGVTLDHLTTPGQALAWFDAERRSLIAAVTLAAGSGLDTYAWQLPWALETFLYRRSHWHDWSATQHTALEAAQRLGDYDALTEAHSGIAAAQMELGRPDDALGHLAQALRCAEEADDLAGQVGVHLAIARAKGKQGRFSAALNSTQHGLRLAQAASDKAEPVQEAVALNQMGWELSNLGRYQEALGYCQRAVTLFQQLGDWHNGATALDSLAYTLCHLGRHAEAAHYYRRVVEINDQLGERYTQAETLKYAGDAHHAGGDSPAAQSAWTRALDILKELHHPDASQVLARLDSQMNSPGQHPAASAGGAG